MTDGGKGIALLSPFTNERFFLPWRFVPVSPIGASRFFRTRRPTCWPRNCRGFGPSLVMGLFIGLGRWSGERGDVAGADLLSALNGPMAPFDGES